MAIRCVGAARTRRARSRRRYRRRAEAVGCESLSDSANGHRCAHLRGSADVVAFGPCAICSSSRSTSCHRREASSPRRRPRHSRRITAAQTSTANQQPISAARPEPDFARSLRAWTEHAVHQATSNSEARHVTQAGDAGDVPQGLGRSKVPPTVLLLLRPSTQARPERTIRGSHCCDRRDEVPKSRVQPHANRATNLE